MKLEDIMKIEFHSLYWPNTDSRIITAHQETLNHFDFEVNYHSKQIDHGRWMDTVIKDSKNELIGFFDIDCVPTSRQKVLNCIKKIQKEKTFLGIAQVANHIKPKSHIYAAPAFFIIHKECYEKIDKSMTATAIGDVCETFCYFAEHIDIPYYCLYPDAYFKEPKEGVWRLGNYGNYGIGTIFDSTVYHLYQSRITENVDLFEQHCYDIRRNMLLTSNNFISSKHII